MFDGFELLDVFGPVELLSRLPDEYPITYVAPSQGLVRSSQGAQILADASLADAAPDRATVPDIVLIPGGMGTRTLADDATFLAQLQAFAASATIVASVCTGSALLAAAGLLDGYRATSNKMAFAWAASHGTDVTWVREARWVTDRDRWTSSGVTAGMDMMAALIAHLSGPDAAATAAREIEYQPHTDPAWDPFAAHHGLA